MSPLRKEKLTTGEIYHTYTRSIAKFVVLNDKAEFERFSKLLKLCRYVKFEHKLSNFLSLNPKLQNSIIQNLALENDLLVEVIAYCIMPTHIHLLLKQITDDGISKYMARVLNVYSLFFNIKHKRLGPLWSGRFKNVRVEDDEQFLHLTRYIHLNPTSAGIVQKPEEWENSSYIEYIRPKESQDSICNFKDLMQMTPKRYQKFVEDRKDYQKNISLIKHQMIDDYSG